MERYSKIHYLHLSERDEVPDNKLHDETYLKENLEKLFAYRTEQGFTPLTPEPPEGCAGTSGTGG